MVNNVSKFNSKTTPANGGYDYKELKHLVEKSQIATLDLVMFKKL